jgi:hypothetical protein
MTKRELEVKALSLRALAEFRSKGNLPLMVELDVASAIAVIGSLQLALRHPEHKGACAKAARALIDGLIEMIRQMGFEYNALMARLGDDPEYDNAL